MRDCKLLIIGSGHRALGMALANGDALICEESEFAESDFSLTLKGFSKAAYVPKTRLGEKLLACYEALGLVSDGMYNCSALEIGFCRFALENKVPILLKCRVVQVRQTEQGKLVTLLTNAGLETVRAARVVDTRVQNGEKRLSLLFTCSGPDSLARVQGCFPEGTVEQAFYPDRGALHLPVEGEYNQVLRQIHSRWAQGGTGEKILLFAPRLETVSPDAYTDPIAAFEAGCDFGKGVL